MVVTSILDEDLLCTGGGGGGYVRYYLSDEPYEKIIGLEIGDETVCMKIALLVKQHS